MGVLLVVDAGNSNTHCGVFQDGRLIRQFRLSSRPERTLDEWQVAMDALLRSTELAEIRPDAVALSCVVPPLSPLLQELFTHRFGCPLMTVGPGIRTGLSIGADHPQEIGTDRIVNLVAAVERHGAPAIVVDLGTATTFSIVDASKRYLGGAIAPGLRLAADALATQAARLPHIELTAPKQVIGRNTSDSIRAGTVYGCASLVDGMIARMRAEIGENYPVIMTGGLAPLVQPFCTTDIMHDAELTLYGLLYIFRRNRRKDL